MSMPKDLGPVSAYAYAQKGGYTGTEEEFMMEIANASKNAAAAKDSKEKAGQFADSAETSKTQAESAAAAAHRDAEAAAGAQTAAGASARNAAASESSAQNHAGQAASKAGEAAASAQRAEEAAQKYDQLVTRLKSGAIEDAELHLGFYLDENGDLCQKEE